VERVGGCGSGGGDDGRKWCQSDAERLLTHESIKQQSGRKGVANRVKDKSDCIKVHACECVCVMALSCVQAA
jgi:hypothetical protein